MNVYLAPIKSPPINNYTKTQKLRQIKLQQESNRYIKSNGKLLKKNSAKKIPQAEQTNEN